MPKVEVKLDMGQLAGISRAAQDAALAAVGVLREEVISAQVMPFDYGHMQNDQTSVVQERDGDAIHTMLATDAPQARRLYYHPEYNFQTVNNPNAQGEWLKPWLPGGDLERFLPNAYEQILKARMPK